jgi:hypothetical protein
MLSNWYPVCPASGHTTLSLCAGEPLAPLWYNSSGRVGFIGTISFVVRKPTKKLVMLKRLSEAISQSNIKSNQRRRKPTARVAPPVTSARNTMRWMDARSNPLLGRALRNRAKGGNEVLRTY